MFSPLTFAPLDAHPEIFHGIFNRHGGESREPFHSLNVSFGVDDNRETVMSNRLRIKTHLAADTIVSGEQVHDRKIFIVEEKPARDLEIPGFDAFISNVTGVALMVQQADCQAVLLFDPARLVVANIHCGWRGSVTDIIGKTVATMHEHFQTDPADLLAAISPSLGPCCAEFVNFRTELPRHFHTFQVKPHYFDFPAISRMQLCESGLKPENIFCANTCTRCDRDWFSYRRDRKTGRFCSVIGLKSC